MFYRDVYNKSNTCGFFPRLPVYFCMLCIFENKAENRMSFYQHEEFNENKRVYFESLLLVSFFFALKEHFDIIWNENPTY